jgi:6-phosphogluconolactonase (cycloisomerase 2 family)
MYVGNQDGSIDAFRVNTDGTLVPVGPPLANAGSVSGLAVDSSGQFLYASHSTGLQLRVFSIHQTTGALSSVGANTVTLAAGSLPRGIAIDGAGHLYVALAGLNQVAQFSINSSNGALTSLGANLATGLTPDRVAVTPNGAYLYVANYFGHSISIYTIGGGGALSAAGTFATGTPTRPFGLVVHHNGNYLIVAMNSAVVDENVRVYSIGAGGALTQVALGTSGLLANPQRSATGVTVDPSGNYIYVSNSGEANVTKFNFNTGSGTLTAPLTFATGANPQFLLSRLAPSANLEAIPTLSTWSFIALGMLLAGASALLYRRAYR